MHGQNSASVTQLVSHLFGIEIVSLHNDVVPVCTALSRCLVLMMRLERVRKALSQERLDVLQCPLTFVTCCDTFK